MKTPRATKLLALFLAFVFSLYLVPTEVLAAEVGSQSAVQAEIDTETAAEENPEIVTELAEGRGQIPKGISAFQRTADAGRISHCRSL